MKFIRNSSENAYIQNKETGEELTVENWFKDDSFKLDEIIFSDGSVLNREDLIEKVSQFETTEGDDTLVGNSNDDTLDGVAGNDYLEGGNGDDIYIWGTGSGNDTINNIMLNWGGNAMDSGKDKLEIKGINAEELIFKVSNNDLVIENLQNGEKLTVNQFFFSEYGQFDKCAAAHS